MLAVEAMAEMLKQKVGHPKAGKVRLCLGGQAGGTVILGVVALVLGLAVAVRARRAVLVALGLAVLRDEGRAAVVAGCRRY